MYDFWIYIIDDVLMVDPLRPFTIGILIFGILLTLMRVLGQGDSSQAALQGVDLDEDDDE